MIEITHRKIDTWKILQSIHNVKAGGHVHFVGTIRDDNDISGIEYDCYEAMALSEMMKVISTAQKKWPIMEVSVVHRVGWVPVGEEAVVVAVACAHRREAFEACEYIINTIKHEVPIWKMGEGAQDCCSFTKSVKEGDDITGVILAGGKSSRFGTNKAFAPWKNHTFIEEILREMKAVFSRVLIVTNTPEDYRHLGVEIICDSLPHQGPLGGLEAALKYVGGTVFITACDMPLVSAGQIKKIVSSRSQKSLAVIASHGAGVEYLLGLYSEKLLSLVQEQLSHGHYSMKSFCEKISDSLFCAVSEEACLNINDPKTFESLRETAHVGG